MHSHPVPPAAARDRLGVDELFGALHFAETPMRTPQRGFLGHQDDGAGPVVGGCTVDVPLMSGYGGNHVLMPPSGLSVIRFVDAGDYEVSPATRAAEMYRSSCR